MRFDKTDDKTDVEIEEDKLKSVEVKVVVESKPLDHSALDTNEEAPDAAEVSVQNENDMNLSSEFDEVCVTKAKENTANESADDVKADEFYEWFTRELFDIEKENDVKKEFELNDDPHYKQVFDGACCNDKVDANKTTPLLQTIYAIVIKTLHTKSEEIAQLPKSSLSNTFQPVTLSPSLTRTSPVLSLTSVYSSIPTVTPFQAATVTPAWDSTLPPLPSRGTSWPQSAVKSQASICAEKSLCWILADKARTFTRVCKMLK